METELKLTLDPADLRRVDRLPCVRRYAQGKPARRELRSVYFDTPSLELLQARMALRVRHDGERWVQTVKSAASGAGGLHVREEVEAAVAGAAPELAALPRKHLPALLRKPAVRANLRAVFTTVFTRTTWQLRMESGTRVELARDTGSVSDGDVSTPICELELELKEGRTGDLYALALELAGALRVRLDNVSKSERGYALRHPVAARIVRAGDGPELRAGMCVEEALEAILLDCLAQVQGNDDAARRGADDEGVHQMRVGLRRLRAAMNLFRAVLPRPTLAAWKEDIRPLNEALAAARDADVFAATLERLRATAARDGVSEPAWEELCGAVAERRAAAHGRLRAVLDAPAYTLFLLRILAWVRCGGWRATASGAEAAGLSRAVLRSAPRMLARADKRARALGRLLRRADAARLHELRLAAKKLRYAVEFLAALFPRRRVGRYRRSLQQLQARLGVINDSVTAGRFLDALACRDNAAALYLRGWHERGREQAIADLARDWRDFATRKPFWRKRR